MAQGHSVDEYLETIYFLAFPIGEYRPQSPGSPTLASRVAEMLGVSRASAGEMLKRLESERLIERGEHKEALLTPAGRKRAEKVVRKHRIIERLLTDFMGYSAAEAHVHADELGDTFSDDMVERIEARRGALPALFVASCAYQFVQGHAHVTTTIFDDELLYSKLAQSLAAGHGLTIRGAHYAFPAPVALLLQAPAWLFGSMPDGYATAK